MKKKYLVTGGGGFLGSALVKRLVAEGASVRVFDDNSRGHPRRLVQVAREVDNVFGDIRDADAVARAVAGVDAVVHMAYINGTRFFYERPAEVLDVGIRGMLHVLDACRVHGVKELVLASSSEVYQMPAIVPTPEDVPLVVPDIHNPRYSYGGGKIASELLAIHSGLARVVIARPHNVYGPDMGHEHVVPEFVERMLRLAASQPEGEIAFPILGSGTQTRAFVHIDDFTDALFVVLERGADKQVYHLGNPEPVTIRNLAIEVARAVGRSIGIRAGEAPAGETPRRCPDISKVRALGFEPRISLRAGIDRVVRWHRQAAKGEGIGGGMA